MTEAPGALERRLHDDVLALGEELADDESAPELYRALANTVRRTRSGPEGPGRPGDET